MKSFASYTKAALLFLLVLTVSVAVSGAFSDAEAAQKRKKTSKIDPTDPSSVIYLDTAGKPAGIGDPNKPASLSYKQGRGWHPQALSASGLAKDRYGLIDWARLVRENLIKPRHSLKAGVDEMPPLAMDVLIEAKGDFVDDVIYPHEMHTYWLKCEVCHPSIFIPAAGQNNMTMIGIAEGQWCGRCHGKVAFPLTDCTRCHVSPKKSAKK
ncbi:MAG: hypothetical protein IME99_05120 [Proteobacteria bacterium]|nr:hypothetical protein [Pseudomonadota bacterium]